MKRFFFLFLTLLCVSSYASEVSDSTSVNGQFDEAWVHSLRDPKEGLMKALINYYQLSPDVAQIFYCLAVSNTNNFMDKKLMAANNLYGICLETSLNRYCQYMHWSESIKDVLDIYKEELGDDFGDKRDLLDCISLHFDKSKISEMSRYHKLYFGSELELKVTNNSRKRNGGLPW